MRLMNSAFGAFATSTSGLGMLGGTACGLGSVHLLWELAGLSLVGRGSRRTALLRAAWLGVVRWGVVAGDVVAW